MKILISPSKSLSLERSFPSDSLTIPRFHKEALEINKILRKKTPQQLSSLMSISEKLSELNWQRNNEFDEEIKIFPEGNSRPCIFCFSGDVYSGFDVESFPKEKWGSLQAQLRIVSGLYGLLLPMDLIQPYRLEMGIKMPIGKHRTLSEFWKNKITNFLNEEISDQELVINLLSNEYASAIDFSWLKVKAISPIFKNYKNGEYKIVGFFAKRARGVMARAIISEGIQNLEELISFNEDGYKYSEELTKNRYQPIFVR